jgi:hypothetical protein
MGSISDQFPTRGTSFEQSSSRTTSLRPEQPPPRTTSLCSEQSPPRTTSRSFARAVPVSDRGMGHDRRCDPETQTSSPRRVGDRFPMPCKHTSWRLMRAAGLDRSLNADPLSCTTILSPSSPTLLHASSARGTQAPPTTGSGLRLGLNMAGQSSTRADLDTNELIRRGAKRLSTNSPTRPRGGFHDMATQLHFNAS